ncbi:protein of unknown function [uncultured Woeseiaceae bacterium]|uniref:Uncharacterized protein n=1 Tax=uncultured Woeseiaceae bacterium TaxID=1983305 RepID=A0A7D9H8A1_9GAMM|nr:protein of unknown function [uncultured Woeseiaceae bacterium]
MPQKWSGQKTSSGAPIAQNFITVHNDAQLIHAKLTQSFLLVAVRLIQAILVDQHFAHVRTWHTVRYKSVA